ncbi:hypothetical protein GQ53DRAFT_506299 [Thozetella sp. PMI_491]|nr:hypothetical protein GQ53DRAFT_506299 [Thozetella sp. PMI_491]
MQHVHPPTGVGTLHHHFVANDFSGSARKHPTPEHQRRGLSRFPGPRFPQGWSSLGLLRLLSRSAKRKPAANPRSQGRRKGSPDRPASATPLRRERTKHSREATASHKTYQGGKDIACLQEERPYNDLHRTEGAQRNGSLQDQSPHVKWTEAHSDHPPTPFFDARLSPRGVKN